MVAPAVTALAATKRAASLVAKVAPPVAAARKVAAMAAEGVAVEGVALSGRPQASENVSMPMASRYLPTPVLASPRRR